MNIYLEAEKKLAELLGWTNIKIKSDGYASYGCPPEKLRKEWGMQDGRRGSMPRWVHDNAAAFALMVEHNLLVDVDNDTKMVRVTCYPENTGRRLIIATFSDHPDKETAVRYAIVRAVIAKLEAAK